MSWQRGFAGQIFSAEEVAALTVAHVTWQCVGYSMHAQGQTGECRDLTAVPAQLWSQIVHINLDLLQGLPVQRLQPYALHKPLHAYPGDACK